jgi:hypothetical protein
VEATDRDGSRPDHDTPTAMAAMTASAVTSSARDLRRAVVRAGCL